MPSPYAPPPLLLPLFLYTHPYIHIQAYKNRLLVQFKKGTILYCTYIYIAFYFIYH
ncbi:hypothetical protein CLU79DRAFT_751155 [Phycomyces nitens]|nr:hypothetical protein CLU79DRAFT_751155 [Phycomyces nitens]